MPNDGEWVLLRFPLGSIAVRKGPRPGSEGEDLPIEPGPTDEGVSSPPSKVGVFSLGMMVWPDRGRAGSSIPPAPPRREHDHPAWESTVWICLDRMDIRARRLESQPRPETQRTLFHNHVTTVEAPPLPFLPSNPVREPVSFPFEPKDRPETQSGNRTVTQGTRFAFETTSEAMDVAMATAKANARVPRRRTRAKAIPRDLSASLEKFRSPGHAPREVVQVQLRSLQLGNEEAFLSLCSQLSCGLHELETWTGEEATWRKKNFGRCGSVLDEAGRRMLPFLSSFEELSALHTTSTKYQQRTRVVSTTGERGVFAWYLHSHAGYWMVDAVRLVEAESGSGSGSPEEVLQGQLLHLKRGDIAGAHKFNEPGEEIDIPNVSRAGKSTFSAEVGEVGEVWGKFGALLRSPAYQLLLGHESAEVISTCSVASGLFKVDVLVRGKWMSSVPFCEAHYEGALFSWTLQLQETLGWKVKKIRRIANIPVGK